MIFFKEPGIFCNKHFLEIDLDADLNRIVFLKLLVFENELVEIIICEKIKTVITLESKFDNIRYSEKCQGFLNFRL